MIRNAELIKARFHNPVGMADIVTVDFNPRAATKFFSMSSVGTVHLKLPYMYRSYGTQ